MIKIKVTLIILGTLLSLISFCQNRTITGRITDYNRQPLTDVKVFSSDTVVSYSGLGGIYVITLPESADSIFFYKSGYTTGKVYIGKRTEIDLSLDVEQVYDLSFEDLLNTKVKTVSLREQNINEAPGVVTVITKDEIKKMGIRTIKDVLSLVPGYSLMQNDDEQIFSVRGIFATTNQKILVMRDGHSLNEANLDIPQIEYSLSVENIEKIEIIRGSGASIYGNSALASVVNIITSNKDNTAIKAGIGNFGQIDFDGYSYKKLSANSNVLIYGRYSDSKGQEFPVTYNNGKKGVYRSGHYPNNYDIGLKYHNKSTTVSFSTRRHEYKTYWVANGSYTNTDSLLVRPGLQMNTLHVNVAYEPKIRDNLSVHFIHFIDNGKLDNNRLLSQIDSVKYTKGRLQLNEWNASRIGTNYFTQWGYSDKGQMLGGFSLERRNYFDSWLASNTSDSSKIVFSTKPFFPRGNELRGAAYVQAQHELFSWLKLDLGVRYDVAQKFKSSFNPRVALIASPLESFFLKIIYTEAFQAPGYSYRTSNADFSGSIGKLRPEKLSTFQGSIRYNNNVSSYFELTFFHNKLKNLITRTESNYYANYGKVASYGLEFELKQNLNPIGIFFNYSLLLPQVSYIDSAFKTNNIFENEFRHFSKHTLNGGILYYIRNIAEGSLYGQYASGFHSLKEYKVDDRFLLNTSVTIFPKKRINLSISIYNIFNQRYKLGDPSVIPILQPGRWWIFSATFNI